LPTPFLRLDFQFGIFVLAIQLTDTLHLTACARNVGCCIRIEPQSEFADGAAFDPELLGTASFTFFVKGAVLFTWCY
jgi:hypothetical protein